MTEVSERELIERIEQALAREAWPVRHLKISSRSEMAQFGKYYLFNAITGKVTENIDLEELGRKLGVLGR